MRGARGGRLSGHGKATSGPPAYGHHAERPGRRGVAIRPSRVLPGTPNRSMCTGCDAPLPGGE